MQKSKYSPFCEGKIVLIHLYNHQQWDVYGWWGHSTIWGPVLCPINSNCTAAVGVKFSDAEQHAHTSHRCLRVVSHCWTKLHQHKLHLQQTSRQYGSLSFSLSLALQTLERFDSHGSPWCEGLSPINSLSSCTRRNGVLSPCWRLGCFYSAEFDKRSEWKNGDLNQTLQNAPPWSSICQQSSRDLCWSERSWQPAGCFHVVLQNYSEVKCSHLLTHSV